MFAASIAGKNSARGRAVRPCLERLAADESRFSGVTAMGVDERVWYHTRHKSATKRPTMLTGMVDLTRDQQGRTRARLLDLVPRTHWQGVHRLARRPQPGVPARCDGSRPWTRFAATPTPSTPSSTRLRPFWTRST